VLKSSLLRFDLPKPARAKTNDRRDTKLPIGNLISTSGDLTCIQSSGRSCCPRRLGASRP
jgi:hypothetical protein